MSRHATREEGEELPTAGERSVWQGSPETARAFRNGWQAALLRH